MDVDRISVVKRDIQQKFTKITFENLKKLI